MALLPYQEVETLRKEFANLVHPVTLTVFSRSLGSDTCLHAERLVVEIAECSDKLTAKVLNLVLDRQQAEGYGIDRAPAIVVEGEQDYGIRFFGLPLGYEFTGLIEAILVASRGAPDLAPETVASLTGLTEKVHIRVFTTPG